MIAVGASGNIWYSSNAGSSWTSASSSVTTVIYCLSHSSASIAMAGGASSFVSKTSNGGQTWTKMTVYSSSSVTIRFHSITMLSDTNAYVAGSNGEVYMTTDFGVSWTRLAASGITMYSIAAYDSANIIVGGASGFGMYVMVDSKYLFVASY